MDHAEARELLELAAVEPGGLEELGRGGGRSALSRHLAECPDCTAQLHALRRDTTAIRDVIRTLPPAGLRDRTLAYVAEVGRPRSAPTETVPALDSGPSAPGPFDVLRGRPAAWAASLAAVLVLSVAGSAWVVGGRVDSQLAEANAAISEQRRAVAGLTMLADWTLRLSADDSAGRARLASTSGSGPSGSVLFSSGTRELVMVASGLELPAAGAEYHCWIETSGGDRTLIGRMYFAGDLAFWVGEVEALADAGTDAGATAFGVSLVEAGSDDLDGLVVLRGET